MIRKSMLTAVVVVLAVLSLSALCWAPGFLELQQVYRRLRKALYEIVTWEETWDYELDEKSSTKSSITNSGNSGLRAMAALR